MEFRLARSARGPIPVPDSPFSVVGARLIGASHGEAFQFYSNLSWRRVTIVCFGPGSDRSLPLLSRHLCTQYIIVYPCERVTLRKEFKEQKVNRSVVVESLYFIAYPKSIIKWVVKDI